MSSSPQKPSPKTSGSKPTRSSGARKPPATTPVTSPVEPATAIGGKLFITIGIVLVMGLFTSPFVGGPAMRFIEERLGWAEKPPVDMRSWQAGKLEDIEITLVTADYEKLACAFEREVGGAHCEFKTGTEKWPVDPAAPVDDNKQRVIQPYSAVPDNALVMLAGLWAQPEVAMRLHAEPYQGADPRKLARFIARCKVRPVERVDGIQIRWATTDAWAKGALRINDQLQEAPWVAIVESCTVSDE